MQRGKARSPSVWREVETGGRLRSDCRNCATSAREHVAFWRTSEVRSTSIPPDRKAVSADAAVRALLWPSEEEEGGGVRDEAEDEKVGEETCTCVRESTENEEAVGEAVRTLEEEEAAAAAAAAGRNAAGDDDELEWLGRGDVRRAGRRRRRGRGRGSGCAEPPDAQCACVLCGRPAVAFAFAAGSGNPTAAFPFRPLPTSSPTPRPERQLEGYAAVHRSGSDASESSNVHVRAHVHVHVWIQCGRVGRVRRIANCIGASTPLQLLRAGDRNDIIVSLLCPCLGRLGKGTHACSGQR